MVLGGDDEEGGLDPPSAATVENLEIMEDEDGQEIEIPPLSSYVTAWKFWCTFAIWPVAFLFVNVIAFSTLMVFDRREYYSWYSFDSPRKRTAERIAMFQTNTAVIAIVLFIDLAILLKAALYMEEEIVALDSIEEDTNVAGHHTMHLHAQVSRKMDRFFYRKRCRPRVSFFVSLLYLAAILVGASSLTCLGLRAYSGSRKMKRDCAIVDPGKRKETRTGRKKPKTDKPIDGVPAELQKWARRWHRSSDDIYRYSNFIRLNDGRIFFRGFEAEMMDESNDDDVMYSDDDMYSVVSMEMLVSAEKDGTIKEHYKVVRPYGFINVNGKSQTESQVFCCFYEERNKRRRYYGGARRQLMCVASGEDVSNGLRNISLPSVSESEMVKVKVKAHNGALYLEYTSYDNIYQNAFAHMEIYKLSPDEMRLQSIANVTGEENVGTVMSDDGSGGACNVWIDVIICGIASIVVFPASYLLSKKKSIPSGLAPAVLIVFKILGYLTNDEFAIALGFATAIAISTHLLGIGKLPRRISREMLVWVYYAIICYFSAWAWKHHSTSHRGHRYSKQKHKLELPWWSFVVLSTIVGLLLNHPVLQVSGWIAGTALVSYGLFGSLIELGGIRSGAWEDGDGGIVYDDDFVYSTGSKDNNLWMVPVGLVIGCGLAALGHALTKYRAFVVFYMAKLWRATANVAAAGRGGDDMTTGLLSRRNV